MKKVTFSILSIAVIGIMALSFSSCSDDPVPSPTVTISSSVVDYTVAFTALVTNTDTYAWEFGDGETSTEQNPTHEYLQSGTFNVTLTVTGGGGSETATTSVTIAASVYEMLTGGPALTNGKSWVMSSTDAVLILEAEDATLEDIDEEYPAGILGMVISPDEFLDTFTFLDDGTYNQDPINGGSVASALYAMFEGINFVPSALEPSLGLADFTPGDATFTFNDEDDLTMTVMPDPDFPDVTADVTYTDFPYIEITGGGFMGIIEWPRQYVVFELTTDKLVVGIFAHFPQLDPTDYAPNFYPTHLLKIAFVPAD